MGPNDLARQLDAFRNEVPTHLRFGVGTMRETASICAPIGSRILVVTGRQAMQRCGAVQQLCADLDAAGIAWARWAGLHAGPTTDDIDRGAAACREFGADMVLALGGGNVIDGAKAIAAVAPSRHRAADFLYGQAVPGESTLPIVAMPTTAGTGSELNRSAIMTDPQRQFRDGIRSDWLFPRVAIVDAALMCSLDRLQTAITGFDCLSHAVESYVSPKARPDTDRLARQAMQPRLPVSSRRVGRPGRHRGKGAVGSREHHDGYQLVVRGHVLSASGGQGGLCPLPAHSPRSERGLVLPALDCIEPCRKPGEIRRRCGDPGSPNSDVAG